MMHEEMEIKTTGKRLYWLKLPLDFFTRPHMLMLQAQENGAAIIVLLLRMMQASANSGGYLRFSDSEPYTPEIMAVVFSTPKSIVEAALTALNRFHVIEFLDDKTIYIVGMDEFIGSESVEAAKKREQRRKKAASNDARILSGQCRDNVGTMSTYIEIEKDKEKDKEKERERETANAVPRVEEIKQYCIDNHKKVNPVVFFNYYETHDWKDPTGKRSILPIWRKVIDLWDARQREKDAAQNGPKYMENDYNFAEKEKQSLKDLEAFLADD